MPTAGGFLLASDGSWEVTTDPVGASWQSGFLRGPRPAGEGLGPLVVTTDPSGTTFQGGYRRSASGALLVEDAAGTYSSGTSKTATGALAVVQGGTAFGRRSVSGLAPPTEAPVNVGAPAITGTPETGSTVTVSSGSWQNSPTSYAYQWKRAGANIAGATTNSYVLQVADEGQAVKCTVTATNGIGSTPADSNTITPSAPAPSTMLWDSGEWGEPWG
jgi:hypothetical protein